MCLYYMCICVIIISCDTKTTCFCGSNFRLKKGFPIGNINYEYCLTFKIGSSYEISEKKHDMNLKNLLSVFDYLFCSKGKKTVN